MELGSAAVLAHASPTVETLQLVPLKFPRLIAYSAGFSGVLPVRPEDWIMSSTRLAIAGDISREWTEDGMRHSVEPRAQLLLPCPRVLLENGAHSECLRALWDLARTAEETVRPIANGVLDLLLVNPAVDGPDGLRVVVLVREHWARQLRH